MKTKGLIAAPPTAFHSDGNIDIAAVEPLAMHLKRQGVAGVFVNGTTGEGMSLTTEEREQQAAEWRRVLPEGMKLFIHVGHVSLHESVRMVRHARAIGADAVAAIPPTFFKPSGLECLVDCCASMAAAAPDLPFYFYHMPSMTGVNVNVTAFLEIAAARIPNLTGVKFTHEAMGDFLTAQQVAGGRFDMLWGRDEMLLGALAMGAEGGVGSTYNLTSPLYLKLIDAFQRNDLQTARDLQIQAAILINAMADSGNFFSALKAILQAQGLPITPATRNPLRPLTSEQAKNVSRKALEIIGKWR